MRSRSLALFLPFLWMVFSIAALGQDKSVTVAGKWQISWEARFGTERGTIQFEQAESKLSGNLQARVGSPKVTGAVDGNKVSFDLAFQGPPKPFTLVFTGTMDGDKMAGKFEIKGMTDGYDWHGENAHPTSYTWTAVRQPDRSQADTQETAAPANRYYCQQVLIHNLWIFFNLKFIITLHNG